MKNTLRYIVLIVCISLYWVSSSESLTKSIAQYKYSTNSVWSSDKYRYGDLYGLCFLPEYKIQTGQKPEIHQIKFDLPGVIDLYALCDSYLWSFVTSAKMFDGVDKYQYVRSNEGYRQNIYVKLDSSKLNVLLIEMSERNIRFLLKDMKFMRSFLKTQKDSIPGSKGDPSRSNDLEIMGSIFNRNINANLESNIWDVRIFTPVKELKAELNYKLFGRYPKEIEIAEDKKCLLLAATTDPRYIYSSFQHVSNREIKVIVKKLNELYDLYKSRGFDRVYFSAIPNPVSVLYPYHKGYRYNNLVQRIYGSPELRIPPVDVNSTFKQTKYTIYHPSDSHWNKNGVNLWLNEINAIFKRDIENR